MRVAGVDCGTNTIRLLVLDADGATVHREARIVRLGEGVDAAGRLAPAAVARTLAALDAYAATLASLDVARVRFCATSAVRDARRAGGYGGLEEGVRERLGVGVEVLTGAEEASLTFGGAVARLTGEVVDPVLVVDIGGGSTEVVLGARDAGPVRGVSLDVGAVRLTERHVRSDPPTADELAACAAEVDAALDDAARGGVDPAAAATVVGVAGTVLTLGAGILGVRDLEAVDRARLDVREVLDLVDELTSMTTAERAATGWVDPGRADVLPVGGLVLQRVLRRTGARELVASVGDVLDGIASSLLAPGGSGPGAH